MFGLLKPNKEKVGTRLKLVKDELNLSFTEFGNRLGLKKPTINSYVQGYTLAPLEILEKVSTFSSKPVGWFYFGEIEEYIVDYLKLEGQGALLKDHPEVATMIKQIFLTDEYKNVGWENEFGYPEEAFIDDCFSEIHHKLLREQIQELSLTYLKEHTSLEESKRNDTSIFLSSEVMGYYEATRDFNYGDTEKIMVAVEDYYEETLKNKEVSFDDGFVVGKMINILADERETKELISKLSMELTGHPFSTRFGGEELVKAFQALRPELLKVYAEATYDDYYDWFEK
ncbi:helix-turn-helix transcriptional regulator [Enterococcus faecalis]